MLKVRLLIMAILIFVMAMPAFAQETTTLDVDANIFLDAINQWLPMALGIIAIGVGIAGAFALARYVAKMILDAFNGKL